MKPSNLNFLWRSSCICLVTLTLVSPVAQSSTWVTIGSGNNLIFVPNPSIDSVALENYVSQDNTAGLYIEGVTKLDNIYYRKHTLLNGQWLADAWQCTDGVDVNESGNVLNIDYVPDGLHHYEVGVCMSQTSCNDGWQAGACSTTIKTNNLLVSLNSPVTTLATNGG